MKSDSYEVTGLPGWLPHHTDRQVKRKTPLQNGAGQAIDGSGPCWWGPGIISGQQMEKAAKQLEQIAATLARDPLGLELSDLCHWADTQARSRLRPPG